MIRRIAVFAAFVLCCAQSNAQTAGPLRIATYNLLNYPGTTAAARNVAFRTVMWAMQPDLLVAQEVQSAAGVETFLQNVLRVVRPGAYAAAAFNDGPDSDNALFYDSTKIDFADVRYLETALRRIAEFRFVPRTAPADTIRIFSVHLKASEGYEQDRFAEVGILSARLDSLGTTARYIVAGDFNIYTSQEPAYRELITAPPAGVARCVDPLAMPGGWSRNAAYAAMHTQSPRVRQFEGGTAGGMDDRFDIILTSPALRSAMRTETYTAFGNDGLHYNDSINRLPNMAVPDSVANALHAASDHLPVFADFDFSAAPAAVLPALAEGLGISITPQPVRERATISFAVEHAGMAELAIFNALGERVAVPYVGMLGAGPRTVEWDCRNAPSGLYVYRLCVGSRRVAGTIAVR